MSRSAVASPGGRVPTAVFHSKDGKADSLAATVGVTIKEVLRNNGIPANAVLCSVGGKIVATLKLDEYSQRHVVPVEGQASRARGWVEVSQDGCTS